MLDFRKYGMLRYRKSNSEENTSNLVILASCNRLNFFGGNLKIQDGTSPLCWMFIFSMYIVDRGK